MSNKPTRAQLVRHRFIALIDALDFVLPKVGVSWDHVPSRVELATGLTDPNAADDIDYEATNQGFYVKVEQREFVTKTIRGYMQEVASVYIVYEAYPDGSGKERGSFRVDDEGLQDCVQFLIAMHMWQKVEAAFRAKAHHDALQNRKDCY